MNYKITWQHSPHWGNAWHWNNPICELFVCTEAMTRLSVICSKRQILLRHSSIYKELHYIQGIMSIFSPNLPIFPQQFHWKEFQKPETLWNNMENLYLPVPCSTQWPSCTIFPHFLKEILFIFLLNGIKRGHSKIISTPATILHYITYWLKNL